MVDTNTAAYLTRLETLYADVSNIADTFVYSENRPIGGVTATSSSITVEYQHDSASSFPFLLRVTNNDLQAHEGIEFRFYLKMIASRNPISLEFQSLALQSGVPIPYFEDRFYRYPEYFFNEYWVLRVPTIRPIPANSTAEYRFVTDNWIENFAEDWHLTGLTATDGIYQTMTHLVIYQNGVHIGGTELPNSRPPAVITRPLQLEWEQAWSEAGRTLPIPNQQPLLVDNNGVSRGLYTTFPDRFFLMTPYYHAQEWQGRAASMVGWHENGAQAFLAVPNHILDMSGKARHFTARGEEDPAREAAAPGTSRTKGDNFKICAARNENFYYGFNRHDITSGDARSDYERNIEDTFRHLHLFDLNQSFTERDIYYNPTAVSWNFELKVPKVENFHLDGDDLWYQATYEFYPDGYAPAGSGDWTPSGEESGIYHYDYSADTVTREVPDATDLLGVSADYLYTTTDSDTITAIEKANPANTVAISMPTGLLAAGVAYGWKILEINGSDVYFILTNFNTNQWQNNNWKKAWRWSESASTLTETDLPDNWLFWLSAVYSDQVQPKDMVPVEPSHFHNILQVDKHPVTGNYLVEVAYPNHCIVVSAAEGSGRVWPVSPNADPLFVQIFDSLTDSFDPTTEDGFLQILARIPENYDTIVINYATVDSVLSLEGPYGVEWDTLVASSDPLDAGIMDVSKWKPRSDSSIQFVNELTARMNREDTVFEEAEFIWGETSWSNGTFQRRAYIRGFLSTVTTGADVRLQPTYDPSRIRVLLYAMKGTNF